MRQGPGVLKPLAPTEKACWGRGEAEEWRGWEGWDAGRPREPRRGQVRWRNGEEGGQGKGGWREAGGRGWQRRVGCGGGVPSTGQGLGGRAWPHRLLVPFKDQPPASDPQLGLPPCCWLSPLPAAATATSPSPLRGRCLPACQPPALGPGARGGGEMREAGRKAGWRKGGRQAEGEEGGESDEGEPVLVQAGGPARRMLMRRRPCIGQRAHP